ncbi:MAG: transposase [Pyrinomonadaceae bacterium]
MDVHQACIVIAVLNVEGKTTSEAIIETKTETVRDFIRGLRGELHITFEEGAQAAWLYDLLRPLAAQVMVCNPRHNKLLGAGNKSDRIDALKLAQLLRAGLLKPVYHGESGTRALKEMVRSYECLVSDTTRVMNRIKAIYRSRGLTCAGHDVYREDRRAEWLQKLTEAKQALLAALGQQRARKMLAGVPKLGVVRVAQIIASVDTPHRFRSKRQFWAYCGLAVVTKRVEDGRVRKAAKATTTRGLNGNYNHRLKSVFKSAAQSACASEPFKQQYDALVAKGINGALARLTVTRKLAAITLAIWKRGEPFDAERAVKRAA